MHASQIPFDKKQSVIQAQTRVFLALYAARNAMKTSFGQMRGFEEARIQLLDATAELRALHKAGRVYILANPTADVIAQKALICAQSMGRNAIILDRKGYQLEVAPLLSFLEHRGSLRDWFRQVDELPLPPLGRPARSEIDVFVRTLAIFWWRATGRLPTLKTPEKMTRYDFFDFLADACSDVGTHNALRRVRAVVRQLQRDIEADRKVKAKKSRDEREGLTPEDTRHWFDQRDRMAEAVRRASS